MRPCNACIIGTMRHHLREMRQEHRIAEVYDEVAYVRAELHPAIVYCSEQSSRSRRSAAKDQPRASAVTVVRAP